MIENDNIRESWGHL